MYMFIHVYVFVCLCVLVGLEDVLRQQLLVVAHSGIVWLLLVDKETRKNMAWPVKPLTLSLV